MALGIIRAPLNYQKIMENSSEVLVVAMNEETGEEKYFNKGDMKQVYGKGIRNAE